MFFAIWLGLQSAAGLKTTASQHDLATCAPDASSPSNGAAPCTSSSTALPAALLEGPGSTGPAASDWTTSDWTGVFLTDVEGGQLVSKPYAMIERCRKQYGGGTATIINRGSIWGETKWKTTWGDFMAKVFGGDADELKLCEHAQAFYGSKGGGNIPITERAPAMSSAQITGTDESTLDGPVAINCMSSGAMMLIQSTGAERRAGPDDPGPAMTQPTQKERLVTLAKQAFILSRTDPIKIKVFKGGEMPEKTVQLDPKQFDYEMRYFFMPVFGISSVATIVPHRPGDSIKPENLPSA